MHKVLINPCQGQEEGLLLLPAELGDVTSGSLRTKGVRPGWVGECRVRGSSGQLRWKEKAGDGAKMGQDFQEGKLGLLSLPSRGDEPCRDGTMTNQRKAESKENTWDATVRCAE